MELHIEEGETCADHLDIYFFYSETCPHCRSEKEFLQEFELDYPEVHVNYLLVSENFDLLKEYAQKYNTSTGGVPRTFIGDKAFIGFTEASGELEYTPAYNAYSGYKNQIISQVHEYLGKENPVDGESEMIEEPQAKVPYWLFIFLLLYILTYPLYRKRITASENTKRYWMAGLVACLIVTMFVFMAMTPEVVVKDFAQKTPFPLFVFILAFADGFNPCAFTVFIILLSLLTYTKSKKDMTTVGLVFIITSALMYFIFIMAMILLGSWALERYGAIILKTIGIVIIIAGVINVKDYLFFKKGFSLSIDDNKKSKIMKRAGKIVNRLKDTTSRKSFFIALFLTFVFAVFVNIVELGCSAILPAVYMASLVNSYGSDLALAHVIWTLFYSFVYILPLFAILMNFIYTFKSSRLTESQGRVLKLVSGLFMLLFGIIMILRPEILSFS
ncbi:glutaredoxin family protein [Candidatus Woesearchaeota archaeon]|nr:glutaredoxin family protein [Candidatus Woesearchaeota archaeon]